MIAPLYAIHLGATPFELGLVIAAAALCPMIFGIYSGRVSDRIGFRVPLVVGSFTGGLALILPFLFRENLFVLYITQFIFGLSHVLTLVTMQNLIGTLSGKETRTSNFSFLSLGISISNLLSPFLTGLSIDSFHYRFTYLFLSVAAMIPGLVLLFPISPVKKERTNENNAIQRGFLDLLRSSPLRNILITSGIILTGIGIYEFYLPVYGSHIGLTASMIGFILSVHASAYFFVRLFMPFLVKVLKEDKLLTYCLWITGIVFLLIPYAQNPILLATISFVLGLSLGCCQPLSIAMAYNRSPFGRTGEVLGLRLTINKIVQFLVPIAFGSMVSWLGFFTIFWANAILCLMSGLLIRDKKNLQKSRAV